MPGRKIDYFFPSFLLLMRKLCLIAITASVRRILSVIFLCTSIICIDQSFCYQMRVSQFLQSERPPRT